MQQGSEINVRIVLVIWFMGFATGGPLMHLLLNLKYHGPILIPAVNLAIMAGISISGFFLLKKKRKS